MAKDAAVLVHGLWLNGLEMTLLRRRLARCGFQVFRFHYPSVRQGLGQNAATLQQFLATLNAPAVHLVGHSLGGLLIRRLFHDFPAQCPGRVVTLGSPLTGSHVARNLGRRGWVRRATGASLPVLQHGVSAWPAGREHGVIAGTVPIGLGSLFLHDLPRPNDGMVTVAETRLPGITEHLALPVNHFGMLLSARVAEQVCCFLKTGHFCRAGAQDAKIARS